ncbi:MAG: hypothetical protein IKL28_10715 [Lachnospiraceae bacterium]|nr:hypothetical protein [Lachnospiraceae bacterium]
MKSEKLYDAISDIREDFIEEAENYQFRKKIVPRLVKWGSMAACFCIVAMGASLAMSGAFAKKGAVMNDDNAGSLQPTPTLAPANSLLTVLAYNGALYNVSNNLVDLHAAGIPDVMTPEDCGASLGNLIKTENGYEETVQETDIELYQYAPAFSNTAVYVIRDGKDYMAGLFSNNLPLGDENDYSPISELFRRYGVESAAHISAVQLYSGYWSNKYPLEPEEHKVTGRAALDAFYSASLSMETECYSKEEYTKKMLEENPMAGAASSLKIAKTICITTAEGLKFYLNWAEDDGWLFSSGAGAYYRITEEMQNWLNTYF